MSAAQENYYHIYSATMNPCSWDEEWLSQVEHTWYCANCGGIRQGDSPIDVKLAQEYIPDAPLNFMSGGFPGLIHTQLLSQLNGHIGIRDFRLGSVLDSSGINISDWKAFHGVRNVIIRGSTNVQTRICNSCGRTIYFAMGRRYLYPEPEGADIYGSDLGIVMKESLFRSLDLARWKKKVHVDKLTVPVSPTDGLGILEPA